MSFHVQSKVAQEEGDVASFMNDMSPQLLNFSKLKVLLLHPEGVPPKVLEIAAEKLRKYSLRDLAQCFPQLCCAVMESPSIVATRVFAHCLLRVSQESLEDIQCFRQLNTALVAPFWERKYHTNKCWPVCQNAIFSGYVDKKRPGKMLLEVDKICANGHSDPRHFSSFYKMVDTQKLECNVSPTWHNDEQTVQDVYTCIDNCFRLHIDELEKRVDLLVQSAPGKSNWRWKIDPFPSWKDMTVPPMDDERKRWMYWVIWPLLHLFPRLHPKSRWLTERVGYHRFTAVLRCVQCLVRDNEHLQWLRIVLEAHCAALLEANPTPVTEPPQPILRIPDDNHSQNSTSSGKHFSIW